MLDALHSTADADPEQAFVDGFRRLLTAVTSAPDTWRLVFVGRAVYRAFRDA